ncbi:MAG: TPM domain-containing protein [Albidovulum sp.]|uniref:TPM domain-containing protein n=1 Tax=Albidovulum sp. TaxID=1872424 RepID=UPI003CBA1C43
MIRLAICMSIMLSLCPSKSLADPYPQYMDLHINDFAEVIDQETETTTRVALASLLHETGIEMTVVTIRSRADFDPSETLEAFARRLFDGWGIGAADNNDGILILVVTADRETRIQLGSAYGQAYDVIAQDIISANMVPDFRAGRFADGIESGAIETIDRIALRLATTSPGNNRPEGKTGLFERLDGWIFSLIFVGIVVYGLFRRKAGDAMIRFRQCPGCGRRGLSRHHARQPGGEGMPQDRLVTTVTCRHCDYRDDRERRIPDQKPAKRSRDFGGGKSSGGGASGRW